MIYDINTSNKSFLKLTQILKKLNVKNNKFILALYDESLVGIDPRDPDLSLENKAKISIEIRKNFWYYIREVVRVPVPGGTSPYIIHRGNLAESFCCLNNLNSVVLLPRQHYKTISAAIFYSWLYYFIGTNYSIVFSNKEFADSQLNIKRLKDIQELLPEYLLPHLNEKNDTDNMTLIRLDYLNNSIKALSTSRDSAGAMKLGVRGLASIFY